MNYLLLLVFIMSLYGCNEELRLDEGDFETIRYYSVQKRRSSIRSDDFIQFPIEVNDSLTILPGWWVKKGETLDREDAFKFSLPKTEEQPHIFEKDCGVYLLGTRPVKVNNEEFVIYKYADRSCSADGSGNWFYVPEIGLLVIYSVTWGNLEIMADHPGYEPEIIYYLANYILTDDDFLRKH